MAIGGCTEYDHVFAIATDLSLISMNSANSLKVLETFTTKKAHFLEIFQMGRAEGVGGIFNNQQVHHIFLTEAAFGKIIVGTFCRQSIVFRLNHLEISAMFQKPLVQFLERRKSCKKFDQLSWLSFLSDVAFLD